MRSVFIISAGYGYGGAERQLERIVERIQDDFRITMFAESPTHIAELERRLRPPARIVRLCPSPKKFSFDRQILTVTLSILRRRPDVILANNYHSAMLLAAAAFYLRRVRSRIFVFVHDYAWRKHHVVFKYLPSAHVLVCTRALLDSPDYISQYLVPRGPHHYSVIPNAVSLPPAGRAPAAGGDYVLHLATRNPFKGHIHLIHAAALLRDSGRPMRFISIGPSGPADLEDSLRGEIADAGLGPLFFMSDYVADPSALIENCLCLAVSSISHSGGPEAFGGAIIEAWAYRKPVVVFAAGGPRDMVEHERDGLLIKEGDERAFAEALWRLRSDPAFARRLGENGFAKVRRSFTVERVADRVKRVIAGDEPDNAEEGTLTPSLAENDAPPATATPAIAPAEAAGDPPAYGAARRNALCPCGSGLRYKHCHGHI